MNVLTKDPAGPYVASPHESDAARPQAASPQDERGSHEPQILALHDGWQLVMITVDSGAAVPAGPEELGEEVKEDGKEQKYKSVTGETVEDVGFISVCGVDENWDPLTIKMRVTEPEVSKPVLSVTEIVDKGHKIVFDQDSFIMDKKTKKKFKLYRKDDVFVLPLWTKTPSKRRKRVPKKPPGAKATKATQDTNDSQNMDVDAMELVNLADKLISVASKQGFQRHP